jgi:hypothetical protein
MAKPPLITPQAACYYNDGCVKDFDYVYISSKLKSIKQDERDFSRLVFYKAPRWGKHDLSWNVQSVCYFPERNTLHALSDQGDVDTRGVGVASSEKIKDAGTYLTGELGAVVQIRKIGRHLYVCGYQGQVYRREEGGWVHFDDGLLDREIEVSALHLLSIDGTSDEDIYVVGMRGRVCHFDGSRWAELVSPTNVHLHRVRCVSRDEVYICGKSGVFLKKTPQGFEDHSVPDLDEDFWGIEHYKGKVYLATLSGLYEFDGSSVEPVDTGLEPPIAGYRLDARDGVLWSFGVDDLAWYDGSSWTRVVDPDNA